MLKLYNYCKRTLKYKRTIELENLYNKKWYFCTQKAIPEYNVETQYLVYDKENDDWIIKNIEIISRGLDELKQEKIVEFENETNNEILEIYPCNLQNEIIMNYIFDIANIENKNIFIEMYNFINNKKLKLKNKKEKVKHCNNKDELENIKFKEDIK